MGHWDHGSVAESLRTRFAPDFHYREDFISSADERVLLEAIADVAFATSRCALSSRGGEW